MLRAISFVLLFTGATSARIDEFARQPPEISKEQESAMLTSSSASCEWENGVEYLDQEYGTDHGGGESNQKFDLYTTRAAFVAGATPVPLAVFVHGGAWKSGSKFPVDEEFLALRQRGFHVASINYRLTSRSIKYPKHIKDVELAIAYFKSNDFVQKYKINPEKIVAIGSSAGGHLVSLLGTRNRPGSTARVAAIVNFYGPTVLFEKSPKVIEDMLNCTGSNKKRTKCYRLAKKASPITHVRDDNPPFLNFVGKRDVSCPAIEAFQDEANSAGADYTTHKVNCSKATCHSRDTIFASTTGDICNVDVMFAWIYQKLKLFVAGCSPCPGFKR